MNKRTVNAAHLSHPTSIADAQQSHHVIRPPAVLVAPSLISVLPKGEGENTAAGLLGRFPSSRLPSRGSLLAVPGVAGQQVGCGGSWGGAPPDVECFPFGAGREALAQVAGARAGRRGQRALAAVQEAGVVIRGAFARVSGGAEVGGAVVVRSPAGVLPLVTLAPQDADEGQLELAVVAGVDDGVQAAVEVPQPEDHFEDDIRGAQV